MRKLYCYIDETGLDTKGKLFIVAVVITGETRDELAQICEQIEIETHKGRAKWIKSNHKYRVAYLKHVLKLKVFHGKLNYAIYQDTRDYAELTIETIARVIHENNYSDYKATILIDALPRSQERVVSRQLHQLGVSTRKVRGVKSEENDALVRLADALCGFVRGAWEGQPELQELWKVALDNGTLKGLEK